jgi:hypothetical protein
MLSEEFAETKRLLVPLASGGSKDGNESVLGRISAGSGSSGFGFGWCFSPTVFGFGYQKTSGFEVDFKFYLRITVGAPIKTTH